MALLTAFLRIYFQIYILKFQEVKTNISDEIKNIKSQGEVVLQCFKDSVADSLPPSQQILHIQEVQK